MIAARVMRESPPFYEISSDARIEKFFFEELLQTACFSHFLYLYLQCH